MVLTPPEECYLYLKLPFWGHINRNIQTCTSNITKGVYQNFGGTNLRGIYTSSYFRFYSLLQFFQHPAQRSTSTQTPSAKDHQATAWLRWTLLLPPTPLRPPLPHYQTGLSTAMPFWLCFCDGATERGSLCSSPGEHDNEASLSFLLTQMQGSKCPQCCVPSLNTYKWLSTTPCRRANIAS